MTRSTSRVSHPRLSKPLLALAAWALVALSRAGTTVMARWRELRAEPERGSISVEKAVITAISLALALGLMAAIGAVVAKYQGMIK